MCPSGGSRSDLAFRRCFVHIFSAQRCDRPNVLNDEENDGHHESQIEIVGRLEHDAKESERFCNRMV